MNVRAAWVSVATILVAACGTGGTGDTVDTTSTTAGSTTLDTTVTAPVSIPSARDLDLDLPGAEGDLDLGSCTLRFPIEARSLQFRRGSSELPTEGPGRDLLDDVLDQFATASTVTVVGHASTEGAVTTNDALARDRAAAVAAAGRRRLLGVEFVDHGVGSTSTTVVEDGTEETRSQNRRVELSGVVRVRECPGNG